MSDFFTLLLFLAFAIAVVSEKVARVKVAEVRANHDREELEHKRRKDELALAISAYDRLSHSDCGSVATDAIRAKIVRLSTSDWSSPGDPTRNP